MRIAVCHLVRACNGEDALRSFMDSYEAFPAGVEHDLVVIFKGFERPDELTAHRRRLAGHPFSEVHVPDDMQDIGAYAAAGQALDHEVVCFLNSFSTVQSPDWLAHLSGVLNQPGVELVGATGSWGSHRSYALHLLGFETPYRDVLPGRVAERATFDDMTAGAPRNRLRSLAKTATGLPGEILGHAPFPNPHVRTNAFLLRRDAFLGIADHVVRRKSAAYRFEAGTRGLTARTLGGGDGVRIVGAGGTAYAPCDWPDVDIYFQGNQGELLVADNLTRSYQAAAAPARRLLSSLAWGARARPA